MEPLSFPSRHHMPRQQELGECHPLDALLEMQRNDENKGEDVPIREHLRPFKICRTIKDSWECGAEWREGPVLAVQVCD